jgi:dihydroflavonol-4-reductase
VVLTSSVAGIGPAPPGEVGTEDDFYRGGGLGLAYPDAKHEGEAEALAAGARSDVEVVIVNPSYVFGVPVDRSAPGETSTRMIGNYMRGRLPALVDGDTNVVDVRDVAKGHLLAAERGTPGERYVLGGHDIGWTELIERVAELSGVRHPLLVLPTEAGAIARAAEAAGLPGPISAEGLVLMAQNWRYSSRKARRELGYRARGLERTLTDTIDWYRELIDSGAFGGGRPSALSLAAAGMRVAERTGALGVLRAAERYVGRRMVAP